MYHDTLYFETPNTCFASALEVSQRTGWGNLLRVGGLQSRWWQYGRRIRRKSGVKRLFDSGVRNRSRLTGEARLARRCPHYAGREGSNRKAHRNKRPMRFRPNPQRRALRASGRGLDHGFAALRKACPADGDRRPNRPFAWHCLFAGALHEERVHPTRLGLREIIAFAASRSGGGAGIRSPGASEEWLRGIERFSERLRHTENRARRLQRLVGMSASQHFSQRQKAQCQPRAWRSVLRSA